MIRLGGLYVLEYDANGLGDAGALIYVSSDGQTRTTIAADELTNPTGLEIGANGDIYISNKGFVAGQGEVLRLSLEQETCFDQATVNGATGRWSGLFSRSHLLGDQGAFDSVYNTGGDLDLTASVMSRTPLS